MLTYEIGAALLGTGNGKTIVPPPFPELHRDDWMGPLSGWLETLGEPLLVGLPLLAAGLAFVGYFVVLLAWRLAVIWKWRQRARR
ncbi:MAG: DUF2062 domain-containing protein [Sideroxyarcus sp.]|nr:DUF2062 domain-containing protein [Sideroxyarcus sp.]